MADEEAVQDQYEDEEQLNAEDVLEVIDIDQAGDDESEMGDAPEHEEEEGEEDEDAMDAQQALVHYPDTSSAAFAGHGQDISVFAVALSPSGELAVSGGEDDHAYVWRVADGNKVFECEHKDSVSNVAFNHNGSLVASASLDGIINVWDPQTGAAVVQLDCGDDFELFRWHPKANFIVAGTASGSIYMWDVPAANMTYFSGHSGRILCVEWAPDGRTFASGSEDGSLIVWSPKSQSIISKIDAKGNHQFEMSTVAALAWHPDGSLVAAAGEGAAVKLVHTKTNKVIGSLPGNEDSIESMAFSNAAPYLLATAGLDGSARVYDVTSHLEVSKCTHDGGVVQVRWHPTQPILYSCSLDGTARVWQGRTGEQIAICTGHNDNVLCLDVSKDGQTVVTSGEGGRALVFTQVVPATQTA